MSEPESRTAKLVEGDVPEGTEILQGVEPVSDEVQGRYTIIMGTNCPSCASWHEITPDPDFKKYYRCWNCSYVFTY